jgi:hypothetical protein
MRFEEFWLKLQSRLSKGTAIRNWTAHSNYLGDSFSVVAVHQNSVSVDAPGAKNIQVVPQADFEIVYGLWPDYLSGKVPRYVIRDRTRFSKYVISIIHHLQQVNGSK